MRVIHLLNHTNRLNGHVHAAVDLACAEVKLGHEVAVVSAGGDFDALLAANGVQTIALDQERRPGTILKALAGLRAILKRFRPDVVHAHMMTSAVVAFPVCRLAGVPLVTTVHNEFEKSSILMGLGNRVIAVSRSVGRSLEARGIPGARIDVVLNGTIGSARFFDRPRDPLPLPSPSILFVGGQHPRKGVPDLLAAFRIVHRECPAARLFVVGGGPFLDAYRADAAEFGEAAHFAGPQDNPLPWMNGADIFVLPSHADPAPLVLPEAREAGCAIVATAVDGIPELLDDGRAGILVPPRDPAALAQAILRLARDPAELAEWKRRAGTDLERMTIERVARQTLGVYEAAAAGRRRRPVAARQGA